MSGLLIATLAALALFLLITGLWLTAEYRAHKRQQGGTR